MLQNRAVQPLLFAEMCLSALILLFSMTSGTLIAADISCSDSDATPQYPSGNNIYKKGTVTRNGSTSDGAQTDRCTTNTQQLQESSCNGTSWMLGYYTCANGCVDGACVPPPPTCQEYDGGNTPGVAGFARMVSEADGEISKKLDECEGNMLREQTCSSTTQMTEVLHDCQHGCSNGACLQTSSGFSTSPQSSASTTESQVCTADVRTCPDGSTVKREPLLNCEFKSCPFVPRPSSSAPFSSSEATKKFASSASSLSPRLQQVAKRCARFSASRQKKIRMCAALLK